MLGLVLSEPYLIVAICDPKQEIPTRGEKLKEFLKIVSLLVQKLQTHK
jgi:hypothetical protein